MNLSNKNRLYTFFSRLILITLILLSPTITFAYNNSDPTVSLLQNRISSNFSNRFCTAVQTGLSKDEAMTSAIIKTENIVSFTYNPQKKWIEKEDLAKQISIKVVNECGWSFGLIGKEGINYFNTYFLEVYDKTTPDKTLSR